MRVALAEESTKKKCRLSGQRGTKTETSSAVGALTLKLLTWWQSGGGAERLCFDDGRTGARTGAAVSADGRWKVNAREKAKIIDARFSFSDEAIARLLL